MFPSTMQYNAIIIIIIIKQEITIVMMRGSAIITH
jgi:hypothetical protein